MTARIKIHFKFICSRQEDFLRELTFSCVVTFIYLVERPSILALVNYAYYQNACARERKQVNFLFL